MKLTTLLFTSFLFLLSCQERKDQIFTEYKIKEFTFQEREAKIVFPNGEKNGEWIWRARFWGHEPQLDKALLDRGFHLVYVDVGGLFGNKEAVELWNDYYSFIREKYDLNQKVVLEGMSRGGLIIYNWAAANTDKVACIYADAPVCDIKSWPGGLFDGVGSEADWKICLDVYGLDDESVHDFQGLPIFNCVKIAEAGIPAIHVCGTADEVVPYEENTAILSERFEAAGGKIKLINKEGVGHHPHSLEDPKPILDFILASLEN